MPFLISPPSQDPMAIDQLSKTVLITGVSRGIGLHLTKHYVTIGWNVIAAVRNPEPATKV